MKQVPINMYITLKVLESFCAKSLASIVSEKVITNHFQTYKDGQGVNKSKLMLAIMALDGIESVQIFFENRLDEATDRINIRAGSIAIPGKIDVCIS